jgi:hypothetical protein
MRNLLLATTLVIAGAGSMQPRPAATTFEAAGKWTYASTDEQGSPVSGTMTIAGKAGAYTGTVSSGQGGQDLPITDVFTSANGMVVLASLPDGATAVIKVSKKADGSVEAGWAPVRSMIAAKIERAK